MRRWMEAQTFSPRTGRDGVHLLDGNAARYGDFDDVHLVGMIEREWPDNPGRTVFYPLTLLNQLGWPPERLRLSAARAAFKDLVRLAGRRAWVSTFVLEDDALVEPSPLLDELDRTALAVAAVEAPPVCRMLPEEALSLDPRRCPRRCGDGMGDAAAAPNGARGREVPRLCGAGRVSPARGQAPRDVPRLPVQVFRAVRAPAAGRIR
jgi:hypothetical protein